MIEGQAFLVTKSGEVKYGAGKLVYLNPVTTYSTEWHTHQVIGHKDAGPNDSRTRPYHREMVADATGRFRFEGLPPGDYYLACPIIWHIDMYSTSGGWAHAQVKVEDGKVTHAVVTRH